MRNLQQFRINERDKRILTLEAEVTRLQHELGKHVLGAMDYCKEHSVMRKSDIPWPCGMCEQVKTKAAEAKRDEYRDEIIRLVDLINGNGPIQKGDNWHKPVPALPEEQPK